MGTDVLERKKKHQRQLNDITVYVHTYTFMNIYHTRSRLYTRRRMGFRWSLTHTQERFSYKYVQRSGFSILIRGVLESISRSISAPDTSARSRTEFPVHVLIALYNSERAKEYDVCIPTILLPLGQQLTTSAENSSIDVHTHTYTLVHTYTPLLYTRCIASSTLGASLSLPQRRSPPSSSSFLLRRIAIVGTIARTTSRARTQKFTNSGGRSHTRGGTTRYARSDSAPAAASGRWPWDSRRKRDTQREREEKNLVTHAQQQNRAASSGKPVCPRSSSGESSEAWRRRRRRRRRR